MATVTAIEYSGLIWCPTVSTGAFVARRNGKVFITGNSGFPKSHDVSKAIDKAAGAAREVVGVSPSWRESKRDREKDGSMEVRGENAGLLMGPPVTDAARQWQGWGTALKPALEPITVARKPLAGTVAANVLDWGTGALNIDGCRVAPGDKLGGGATSGHTAAHEGYRRPWMDNRDHLARHAEKCAANVIKAEALGRWPANLIHDGGEPADQLGGAARFFYCAKASKKDRDEGMDGFELNYVARENGFSDKLSDTKKPRANNHPTVKPSDLMAYLCRLVTPPGGIVLDPFMGSGSTGKAAMREGFDFIGIEKDAGYFAIAQKRIEQAQQQLFAGVAE